MWEIIQFLVFILFKLLCQVPININSPAIIQDKFIRYETAELIVDCELCVSVSSRINVFEHIDFYEK